MINKQLLEYAKSIKHLPNNSANLICDCCFGENIPESAFIYYDHDRDIHLCEICYNQIDKIMQQEKIGKYEGE